MLPYFETREPDIFTNSFEDFEFPAHFHDRLEIIFVTQGAIELSVDNIEYTLRCGELAVIFPNQVHDYRTESAERNKGEVLLIKNHLLDEYKNLILRKKPNPVIYTIEELHPDIFHAYEILKSVKEPNFVKMAYVKVILCRLFPAIQTVDAEINSEDILYRVIDYLSNHYLENFTLQDMADAIYIDKYQLSRLFSKRLHCTFSDYINRLRMEYACSLILNTQKSITTIAMESGFDNIRSFHRIFKKFYQITPMEYRKRHFL